MINAITFFAVSIIIFAAVRIDGARGSRLPTSFRWFPLGWALVGLAALLNASGSSPSWDWVYAAATLCHLIGMVLIGWVSISGLNAVLPSSGGSSTAMHKMRERKRLVTIAFIAMMTTLAAFIGINYLSRPNASLSYGAVTIVSSLPIVAIFVWIRYRILHYDKSDLGDQGEHRDESPRYLL